MYYFLIFFCMKLKNTLTALGTTLTILSTISSTWANPDYICTKSVTNQPCVVDTWWPWEGDEKSKTRIGTGKRATHMSYYHVRTDCTQDSEWKKTWYTINKELTKKLRGSVAASWRHGADYPTDWEECTVTQTDRNKPIGNPNKNADQTKQFEVPAKVNPK